MNTLNTAIVGLLRADADLLALGVTGVYKDRAPQSTPAAPIVPPYIILVKQGGTWETHHDGGVTREPRYMIKTVDKGISSARAGNIDQRVGVRLNAERIETADGAAYRCFRTGDMPDYSEVADGVTYNHVGGLYRFVQS